MVDINQKIEQSRRKKLNNDVHVDRLRLAIDRWTKIARKGGVDLEFAYQEDKSNISQLETLENLQKNLQEKDDQLVELNAKHKKEMDIKLGLRKRSLEFPKFSKGRRASKEWKKVKNLTSAAIKMERRKSLLPSTKKVNLSPAIPEISIVSDGKSDHIPKSNSNLRQGIRSGETSREASIVSIGLETENSIASSQTSEITPPPPQVTIEEIEETLDEMERAFQVQKGIELMEIKNLELDFKKQYEIARQEAITSRAINSSILKHNRKIFKVNYN